MKYKKPALIQLKIDVKVHSDASEKTSCAGGHCVRARYGEDH